MKLILLIIMLTNPASAVTYEDVEPILNNRCLACHQHMADKDWGRQENAEGVRVKIRLRVGNDSMPPAPMKLTKEEKKLIIEWTKGSGQWTK